MSISAGINKGGTPAEILEVQRDALRDKAREACQLLADTIGTLDYLEWWETVPDDANLTEITEMAYQALPECICPGFDDNGAAACPACIEQSRRRYSEIPYVLDIQLLSEREQEARNERRTSNI